MRRQTGATRRQALGIAAAAAAAWGLAPLALLLGGCEARDTPAPVREPDVEYEPSPPAVVRAMLELARVGPSDVLFDLGCGDGRIVIEAAARHGARGVGIDIDPARIAEARANAARAGVAERVRFEVADLFEADLAGATVVTLFLWPSVNLRLRPRLQALPPGTRIVSHWHSMGDWAPTRTEQVRVGRRLHAVHLWEIGG